MNALRMFKSTALLACLLCITMEFAEYSFQKVVIGVDLINFVLRIKNISGMNNTRPHNIGQGVTNCRINNGSVDVYIENKHVVYNARNEIDGKVLAVDTS